MGACDSNNNNQKIAVPKIQLNESQNIQTYKFENQMKRIINKKSLNLEFIFSQLKIKHCISHNSSKNSTYITEISIGINKFRLMVNQGKYPVIDEKNIFRINNEFTLKDLEKTLLSIHIYEFTDEININIFNNINELPEEYKQKCKYKSFLIMDLLSFVFKSKKCDFLMIGNKGLSSNTRICFNCDILHREKIKIKAKSSNNSHICKLIFKTKNSNIGVSKNTFFNDYTIITPLITMKELKQADLYFESNQNESPYKYFTLNNLKFELMKKLGENIIQEEKDYKVLNSKDQIYPNKNMNSFDEVKQNGEMLCGLFGNQQSEIKNHIEESNQEANLYLENFPLITQISCLYFTEHGHLFNTSLLHLINGDEVIQNYRKNQKISSDDFYKKLNIINDKLKKGILDFKILDDLTDILRRSIDTEKYYFLYPNIESLYKMIILMMSIGIKIILYVQKEKEEQKLNLLLKSINNLLKREEIDNLVISHCLSNFQEPENTLKNINNEFYLRLLKLNEYCKIKKIQSLNNNLIDIYSNLYFKKKYVREMIFNTLWNKETNYDNYQNEIFIYDIINDEKLNRYLDLNAFNQIIKKKSYFSNLFEGITLLKNIILHQIILNINEFPFDFTLFSDNKNLLNSLGNYIKNKKMENLGQEFFDICLFLSDSYASINTMNNNLIRYTNGYNNIAIFNLFDYLKYLLEYYYKNEECNLIMDYCPLEKAYDILIKIDSCIALPKLFWFYYYCSHLVLGGNLKYFIINICNIYFNKFAYHWSFSVREVFFKLIFYIFNDRLKNEEGKLFNMKNLNNFEKKDLNKAFSNKEESLKDYELINKEYKEWNEVITKMSANDKIEKDYPIFMVPLPINPDKID